LVEQKCTKKVTKSIGKHTKHCFTSLFHLSIIHNTVHTGGMPNVFIWKYVYLDLS